MVETILRKIGNIVGDLFTIHSHSNYLVDGLCNSTTDLPRTPVEGNSNLVLDRNEWYYYLYHNNSWRIKRVIIGSYITVLNRSISSNNTERYKFNAEGHKIDKDPAYKNISSVANIYNPNTSTDEFYDNKTNTLIYYKQYILVNINDKQKLVLIGSDKVSREFTYESTLIGTNIIADTQEKVLSDNNFSDHWISIINRMNDKVDNIKLTTDDVIALPSSDNQYISRDLLNEINSKIHEVLTLADFTTLLPNYRFLSSLIHRDDLNSIDSATIKNNEYLTARAGAELRDRINAIKQYEIEEVSFLGQLYYTINGNLLKVVNCNQEGNVRVILTSTGFDEEDDDKENIIKEVTIGSTITIPTNYKLEGFQILIPDEDTEDTEEYWDNLISIELENETSEQYDKFNCIGITINSVNVLTDQTGLSVAFQQKLPESQKQVGRDNLDVYSRSEVNDLLGSGINSLLRLVPDNNTDSISEQLISNKDSDEILIKCIITSTKPIRNIILKDKSGNNKEVLRLDTYFTAKYSDILLISEINNNYTKKISEYYSISSLTNECSITL